MYMLNYSLDNLSMMALILSVGFVVDDAIVMLENIVRHMEMGKGRFQAALEGSREVSFTIVSMTISLVAVFIPVLFLGGILGRLLQEFAVTISLAILISGVVSLTLTPMLSSRFLRPPHREGHGRMYMLFECMFDRMLAAYDWSLVRVMRHRLATMVASVVLLIATGYLFVAMPKGFLPSEDTGTIFIFTESAEGVSFDAMKQNQQVMMKILLQQPEVKSFFSGIGGGGSSSSNNTGRIFLQMKPRKERPHVDQVIQIGRAHV